MEQVIVIRPAAIEDLAELVALEASRGDQRWSERVLNDELSRENRIYLVAEGESLVGFGGVMIVGEESHITNLLVSPGHRRKGIARRLMVELTRSSVAAGAKHLTLEVRSENSAARALYASFGLAPVGVRKGYYGDDDALIMWAHDIDSTAYEEQFL